MRKWNRLIALALCAALLLSLAACGGNPAETTAPPTEPPTTVPTKPPAAEVYAQARAALESLSHVTLELLRTTYITVAGDEFSEQSAQTLTYKDMGTDEAVIVLDETLDFSVHTQEEDDADSAIAYKEVWYQGNVYAELESTYRYQGSVAEETLISRYAPVVLLNSELYGAVTSETTADGTLLTFAEPSAAESWAVPAEAELVEASGTALVSPEGVILEMAYTVSYTYGNSQIREEIVSRPLDTPKTVTPPANPDTYAPLTYVDALRMSIVTPVMLFQADSATVSSLESLMCRAAGVMRNQSNVINQHGRKEDTQAKIEVNVFLMDYSTGESQELEQEQIYRNGKLTTTTDDGPPLSQSGVSWEDVRTSTSDMMVYGMVDLDYWQDVTMTDMGSVLLLEYALNEEFGSIIQDSICQMLWNDPSFLLSLASKYEDTELTGYLSVDKYSGLPVAAGYYYEGVHTIQGGDYVLSLQFDQSFETPAKGAYQEITEKMPEEAEPETKPTPLFYHVTGENGQEMWLLGTIHVGDERTGYLPQEIYNAFAASDALALECDTEAFDELVEEDDELSEEVSNHYFYSDGTTLESLMEEESYAQAVQLMKAVGGYNMNMPYAKPYLWSNAIDQFYLRQGYQLHGDQGVEERLHDWAEELDKEIREVESNMFQVQLLTGFSNDLQLLMLEESMETTARESWEGVWELYELWCAGDEAALREELSDEVDTSELTEEELAEYEAEKHLIDEYNKAMSYDRNDGMLQKAIEYLESGDVVFYAVGLAHLLNDVNGLVDTLRDAGYTVELVSYAG